MEKSMMRKILLACFLAIITTFTHAELKPDVENMGLNLLKLENIVGKRDSFEFFVPKDTDAYNYFNQLGGYSRSSPSVHITYMQAALKLYPPLWTVKSIKETEAGSIITLDIREHKSDFVIANRSNTYFMRYGYDFGLLTTAEFYIGVLGSQTSDVDNQFEYLESKLKTFLDDKGYKEDFRFRWPFTDPVTRYIKNESLIEISREREWRDAPYILWRNGSALKVAFKNTRFEKKLPELKKEADQKRYESDFSDFTKSLEK